MATENRRVPLPAGMKRVYGELDREQVVAGLHNLARRVGIQRVTMRELAAELGVAVPSVYYHVSGKQAALDLLADSLLASIPLPPAGPWDVRLIEFYCVSREVVLRIPGVASMLQTRKPGENARRLDGFSRSLLAEAGLAKAPAAAAHTVLFTYLLGSVTIEELSSASRAGHDTRQAAARFRSGLDVIIAGIRASAVW